MNKQEIKNEIIKLVEKLNLKNGGNFNNIDYHYSLCGSTALVMLDLLSDTNVIEILVTDKDFTRISEEDSNYAVIPNKKIYINEYTTLVQGLEKHSTINNIDDMNVCNIIDIINTAKKDNDILLLDFLQKELNSRYKFHTEQADLFKYILSKIK